MARIRSVHPGLWTDESFVALSHPARLLALGLWTECDDQGIFAWKPQTLKMRLLPADNVEIGVLLAELEAQNMIRRYEIDGAQLAAVRNFRKFQRPEKPKTQHPITAEIAEYVGLACNNHTCSEKKAPQFGEASPNGRRLVADTSPICRGFSGQMEEGIGKEEGTVESQLPVSNSNQSAVNQHSPILRKSAGDDFEEFWKKYPDGPHKAAKGAAMREYNRARRKASAARIIAAVDGAKWPADARYIPAPARWLADERWMDQGVAVVVSSAIHLTVDPRFDGWVGMDHVHYDRWLAAERKGFPSRHSGHAHYTADERRAEMLESLRSIAPRVYQLLTRDDDQRKSAL